VGGVTIAVMLLMPRHSRVPSALAALVVGCLAAAVLGWLSPGSPVAHLNALRLSVPTPTLEGINASHLGGLALAGLGLFFLATMQSMLCALSCDSQTGTHHHSDQELFGQGAANVAAAFCGAVPVTGVFARSAA